MSAEAWHWLAVATTVALIGAYEFVALALQRRQPERFARSANSSLREQWFESVSAQKGSEILAVQTLRNSLMSASMLASTVALALMGALSLSVPTLRSVEAGWSPRLLLELTLIALLFGALTASVMAVRFFSHASFVGGFPVGTPGRERWAGAGRHYLRRAGVFYSIGLRQLVLVAPVVAGLLSPWAGPAAALVAVGLLLLVDRVVDTAGPVAG